jgi:hydroxymethylbilane synthase
MIKKIKIGTRGSSLALWQANTVKNAIQSKYPNIDVEIVKIKTMGDKIKDVPLAKIGGKGLFLKEIEEALLSNKIDMAVHSMKDVPVILPEGLGIFATLKREDPRDALISQKYSNLKNFPEKSVIGTSSLRRKAQILKYNSGLNIKDLRGNIQTRLKKMKELQYDGIILAMAGLLRLGLTNLITEAIDFNLMIPAVCQGIIGIEVGNDNENIKKLICHLNDRDTHTSALAERAFLKKLGGSCQTPIGCICTFTNTKTLHLKGFVSSIDGKIFITGEKEGSIYEPERLGEDLGNELLDRGGNELVREFL